VGAIALICLVTYHILRYHHRPRSTIAGTDSDEIKQQHADANNQTSLYDAHSALNISLFPPLFFFSALYYTDVMSTLAVLLSYHVYLTQRNMPKDLMHGIRIVVVGVFAMLFRQTNVFWVAVFPAGLTVVDILATKQENTVCTESSARNKFQSAWSRGQVYDVSVGEAGPQGVLSCVHQE
jgi:alpha-1,2-glucosyltransferase